MSKPWAEAILIRSSDGQLFEVDRSAFWKVFRVFVTKAGDVVATIHWTEKSAYRVASGSPGLRMQDAQGSPLQSLAQMLIDRGIARPLDEKAKILWGMYEPEADSN